MKLLEMKCKNCGALLKVEEDANEEKPARRAPRKRVNKVETAPNAEEEK